MKTMPRRLRPVLTLAAVTGLATVPALALGAMEEPGKAPDVAEVPPSCPVKPCLAMSRTTGYQAKVGANRGLMAVKANGRLVSWTITLAKPDKDQVKFFNDKLGGAAAAQVAVLRPGRKLYARTVALGPLVKLQPYFGQTVEFALERSIPVKKGMVIGLNVPTWAPALAVNQPGDTSWRASRKRGACEDTQMQSAQSANQVSQYYCLYRTARLTYSARVITDPKPAATSSKR